jgi:hypothetical protein
MIRPACFHRAVIRAHCHKLRDVQERVVRLFAGVFAKSYGLVSLSAKFFAAIKLLSNLQTKKKYHPGCVHAKLSWQRGKKH